jgi:hypothetical protein
MENIINKMMRAFARTMLVLWLSSIVVAVVTLLAKPALCQMYVNAAIPDRYIACLTNVQAAGNISSLLVILLLLFVVPTIRWAEIGRRKNEDSNNIVTLH